VRLIKGAAQTLAPQGWTDIDLTLGQFGIRTSENFRGADEYDYVVTMLKDADDAELSALDAYLHGGTAPPDDPQPEVVGDPNVPWTTGGFRLFISHIAEYATDVAQLKDALGQHAIEGFVAHEAIPPTSRWEDVIEAGLRTCDGLAAWLTPGFRESKWCDQEVGFVVGRGLLVIPLRLGQDPYGFIGKYQAITMKRNQPFREIALSIFDSVVQHELTQDAMAQALVLRLEQSASFDAVRTNVGYLRKIPAEAWTDGLKTQALTAHERNYEIANAWVGYGDAPEAVASIINSLP
jgi:hypothetical protein